MNLEEIFDQKVEQSLDIKSKRISILDTYGENFQENHYITNPAIGRDITNNGYSKIAVRVCHHIRKMNIVALLTNLTSCYKLKVYSIVTAQQITSKTIKQITTGSRLYYSV